MTDLTHTALAKASHTRAALAWTLLYVASGLLVVSMQTPGAAYLWYPSIAVGFVFLYRVGTRYWPMVLAADGLITFCQFGDALVALIASSCTILEAMLVVRILRAKAPVLKDTRHLVWVIGACVAGPFAGATLGSAVVWILSDNVTASLWLTWWAGDAASSASLLPLLLILTEPQGSAPRRYGWGREHVATLAGALATAWIAFGDGSLSTHTLRESLEPLIFGPVLWAALRLDVRAACIVILTTAVSVVVFCWWAGVSGHHARALVNSEVLEIQLFLVALTTFGVLLALTLNRERRSRLLAEEREAALRGTTEELRVAMTRLSLAAKAGNVGVWDWNIDDNTIVWDDQIHAMYQIGHDTEERYQAWLSRLHPDDVRPLLDEIGAAIERGKELRSNFRVILPSGDVRYFNTHGVIYRGAGEQAERMIGIDYDVTELVRQRLKAEESELAAAAANRAKSEFLAVMSHELRTPLNAIIGFSELMARETLGTLNATYRNYVADIGASGKLLLSLINDILDLTRIEAGKLDLNLEPLAPSAVLTDVARSLAALAEAKNLTFAIEGKDCVPVLADERALRQLLTNLVANSIKFTNENGRIALSAAVSEDGGQVIMTVSDNGRGIPRDRIRDLCKPFVQIADSLCRDVGGIGLGLAISRSLTEGMGGNLTIDSDLGKGTRVSVTLPSARTMSRPVAMAC